MPNESDYSNIPAVDWKHVQPPVATARVHIGFVGTTCDVALGGRCFGGIGCESVATHALRAVLRPRHGKTSIRTQLRAVPRVEGVVHVSVGLTQDSGIGIDVAIGCERCRLCFCTSGNGTQSGREYEGGQEEEDRSLHVVKDTRGPQAGRDEMY